MAGNRKKARKPKTSQGVHGGGGKTTLAPLQKVLMGGGVLNTMFRKTKESETKNKPKTASQQAYHKVGSYRKDKP